MKPFRLRLAYKVALSVLALTAVQIAITRTVQKDRVEATALREAEATLLAEANGFALALDVPTDSITVATHPSAPKTGLLEHSLTVLMEQARTRGHPSFQAAYFNSDGKRAATRFLGKQWEQTDFDEIPGTPGIHRDGEWIAAVAESPSQHGRIVTLLKTSDVLQPFGQMEHSDVIATLLTVLVGAVGAGFIGWQLSRPLGQLSALARKVAETGDLRTPIQLDRNDEIGEVAEAFQALTKRLAELVRAVQISIEQLRTASSTLSGSATLQAETLTKQASALQETQTTAQEIRQTSVLAAQKAEGILLTADKGDTLGRDGEAALQVSLDGLSDLHRQVSDISKQILDLSSRALQIESITQTVKDLANQSNMLALNAAIEASRSGEHGKGFAVVAREIRMLADQSIASTRQVREILEDISTRIVQTAEVTENGARKMETGLDSIRISGEKLRELSGMMREGSSAARQIAAAVSQQSAGIGEIFAAVTEQGRMMDETLQRLSATTDAAMMVDQVAGEVSRLVSGYKT